ncbi:MAG: 50S ribosomal protein L29 [Candidatus Omnitrophica bacterium]|nr:50S ribosomal protein L29 [Candidatus Omnitrophota bacterium]
MKPLKPAELRELAKEELNQKLGSLKSELFKLRCQSKSGSVPSPSQIRGLRRNIARLLTILKEKEIKDEPKKG